MKLSQQGFTLIEQLITLALGALLMAGIASSVIAITKTQNLTRDYGNLQETLSFVTATLTRSARTAKEITTNINTNQISFEQEKEIQSCLASKHDKKYYETYLIENSNLVCKVKEVGGNPAIEISEVLVFGLVDFYFKCALFNKDRPVEFIDCKDFDVSEVIAVKFNLKLDKKQLLEIEKDFDYSYVAYLRNKNNYFINNRDN